jgi:CheY-like chemotaxis protein
MMTAKTISVRNTPGALPTVGAADRAHVLVLDDEPALRELFSAMLERIGCLATICGSSVEAIAAYRSAGEQTAAFDCALIDLHINEKSDGVTVGRMMRDINPKVRLVLISGSVNPKKLASHKALGFDAVLPKPFTLKQLRETIFQES